MRQETKQQERKKERKKGRKERIQATLENDGCRNYERKDTDSLSVNCNYWLKYCVHSCVCIQ